MTIIRALQWLAVVVTGMSRSMSWGQEIAAGKGPPSQWERHVVGATLLLFIAALAMSVTARRQKSGAPGKPGRVALSISALCCLSSLALAFWVRSSAIDRDLPHVLLGGGWLWMLSGGAMALATTSSAMFLRWQAPSAAARPDKARR